MANIAIISENTNRLYLYTETSNAKEMTEFRHVPVLVHEIHRDRCEQMQAVFALYQTQKVSESSDNSKSGGKII